MSTDYSRIDYAALAAEVNAGELAEAPTSPEIEELEVVVEAARAELAAAKKPLEARDKAQLQRDLEVAREMQAAQLAARKVDELNASIEHKRAELAQAKVDAERDAWGQANPPSGLIDHAIALANQADAEKANPFEIIRREVRTILGIEAPPEHLWKRSDGVSGRSWEVTLWDALTITVHDHSDGAGINVYPLWSPNKSDLRAGIERPTTLLPGSYTKLGAILRNNEAEADRLRSYGRGAK